MLYLSLTIELYDVQVNLFRCKILFKSSTVFNLNNLMISNSNTKLVERLISQAIITSERVAEAMRRVDRGDFVLEKSLAYEDCPLSIGYNATISAPHMHAYCLGWLESVLQPGAKVLDVGSGSGYLCAVFNEMTRSKVVGIEHIPELVEISKENL